MPTTPGAERSTAASGVALAEAAEPAEDPEDSADPELELVESWLVPLELDPPVVVAVVEAAVPVPVEEPVAVVAAEA